MSADVIVASDPSDFLDAQRAAFKANLATALDVDPNGVTITAVAAGSTVISFTAICDTVSIANAALTTLSGPLTSLSTALGLTVTGVVNLGTTTRQYEAPSPPPRSPPPSPPAPSPPPPSPSPSPPLPSAEDDAALLTISAMTLAVACASLAATFAATAWLARAHTSLKRQLAAALASSSDRNNTIDPPKEEAKLSHPEEGLPGEMRRSHLGEHDEEEAPTPPPPRAPISPQPGGSVSTRRRGSIEKAPSTRRASTNPATARVAPTLSAAESTRLAPAPPPPIAPITAAVHEPSVRGDLVGVEMETKVDGKVEGVDEPQLKANGDRDAASEPVPSPRAVPEQQGGAGQADVEAAEPAKPLKEQEKERPPPQGALGMVRTSLTELSQRSFSTPDGDVPPVHRNEPARADGDPEADPKVEA